jgi:hypothetical protein
LSIANNGTVYLSGPISFYNPNDTVYFVNADSSRVQLYKRPGIIYSVSKDGLLKWHTDNFVSGLLYANDSAVYQTGATYYNSNLPALYTDTFYNPSRSSYVIASSHNPAINFVKLDTAGSPLWARKTGVSNGPNGYQFTGLFPSDSGGVIACGHGLRYSGTDSTRFYGDSTKFNGRDGYMISYRHGLCDGINTPGTMPMIFPKGVFTDTVVCPGDSITVRDSISGAFYAADFLVMQLSDLNGGFGAPANFIGFAPSGSGVIKGLIPSTVTPGSKYKVRVYTWSPNRYLPNYNITIVGTSTLSLTVNSMQGTVVAMGQSVDFRTTLNNGGTTPQYQWKINGVPVSGAIADTFTTSSLMDQDVVSVTVHGSQKCAKPDSVTKSIKMTVTSPSGVESARQIPLYVFPNPSGGKFSIYVYCQGTCNLELISITGEVVYRETFSVGQDSGIPVVLPEYIISGSYILALRTPVGNTYYHLSLIR